MAQIESNVSELFNDGLSNDNLDNEIKSHLMKDISKMNIEIEDVTKKIPVQGDNIRINLYESNSGENESGSSENGSDSGENGSGSDDKELNQEKENKQFLNELPFADYDENGSSLNENESDSNKNKSSSGLNEDKSGKDQEKSNSKDKTDSDSDQEEFINDNNESNNKGKDKVIDYGSKNENKSKDENEYNDNNKSNDFTENISTEYKDKGKGKALDFESSDNQSYNNSELGWNDAFGDNNLRSNNNHRVDNNHRDDNNRIDNNVHRGDPNFEASERLVRCIEWQQQQQAINESRNYTQPGPSNSHTHAGSSNYTQAGTSNTPVGPSNYDQANSSNYNYEEELRKIKKIDKRLDEPVPIEKIKSKNPNANIDRILRDQIRTLNINDCLHSSNRNSTIRNTEGNANNHMCDFNPELGPAWEMKWVPKKHSAFNNSNEATICNECGCIICNQCGNVDYDTNSQSTKNTEGGNSRNHGSRRNSVSSKSSSKDDGNN